MENSINFMEIERWKLTYMNVFHKKRIILEIKENELFKDLSKSHLAKKKFLKQNFQNFFNVRGESGAHF